MCKFAIPFGDVPNKVLPVKKGRFFKIKSTALLNSRYSSAAYKLYNENG